MRHGGASHARSGFHCDRGRARSWRFRSCPRLPSDALLSPPALPWSYPWDTRWRRRQGRSDPRPNRHDPGSPVADTGRDHPPIQRASNRSCVVHSQGARPRTGPPKPPHALDGTRDQCAPSYLATTAPKAPASSQSICSRSMTLRIMVVHGFRSQHKNATVMLAKRGGHAVTMAKEYRERAQECARLAHQRMNFSAPICTPCGRPTSG